MQNATVPTKCKTSAHCIDHMLSAHLWIYNVGEADMVVREDTWAVVDEAKSKFHCWYIAREVKLQGLGHLQLNGQVLCLPANLCAVLLQGQALSEQG